MKEAAAWRLRRAGKRPDSVGYLLQALVSRAPRLSALSESSISGFPPLGRRFAYWRQRVASPHLHRTFKKTYMPCKNGFICKLSFDASSLASLIVSSTPTLYSPEILYQSLYPIHNATRCVPTFSYPCFWRLPPQKSWPLAQSGPHARALAPSASELCV